MSSSGKRQYDTPAKILAHREAQRRYKLRHPDRVQASEKKWLDAPKNREQKTIYNRDWIFKRRAKGKSYGTPEKLREYRDTWTRNNKEKLLAHAILNRAVKLGQIIRPGYCETCGLVCKPQGHHEDYAKPLEVLWKCQPCHGKCHRRYQ